MMLADISQGEGWILGCTIVMALAAIAAVMNAISSAIPNGAADHMEMPATPSKVWEAVQKGLAG